MLSSSVNLYTSHIEKLTVKSIVSITSLILFHSRCIRLKTLQKKTTFSHENDFFNMNVKVPLFSDGVGDKLNSYSTTLILFFSCLRLLRSLKLNLLSGPEKGNNDSYNLLL